MRVSWYVEGARMQFSRKLENNRARGLIPHSTILIRYKSRVHGCLGNAGWEVSRSRWNNLISTATLRKLAMFVGTRIEFLRFLFSVNGRRSRSSSVFNGRGRDSRGGRLYEPGGGVKDKFFTRTNMDNLNIFYRYIPRR